MRIRSGANRKIGGGKVTDLIAQGIPKLSNDQLVALAKDAEQRIGSHVAGGMPNGEYVARQRNILSMVQEELEKRG
jgi:hypothetical protein